MKTEDIVKELRDVIDCIAKEEPMTATRMALTIINKLQPKPLFVPGPAKLRNGEDAEIYEVFNDAIYGYFQVGGKKHLTEWDIDGEHDGNNFEYDLIPNNNEPVDKIVDDIKKDATEGERKVIIYKDYVTQEVKEAEEDYRG